MGLKGTFPRLVHAGREKIWESISPDPNLILGIPRSIFPKNEPEAAEILTWRTRAIGKSLSLSYKSPIHIVRGFMQFLIDFQGNIYLDAVNNVPHVGHSNQTVVKAASQQAAVLNTNTRYLHQNIILYAQQLIELLPYPLRICFFVNSGSEANELALRMARTHTGQKDIIVVDHAYHGNTTAVIEISPYKFDGPGGEGPRPYIHKTTMPDVFRGPYRSKGLETGPRYARDIQAVIKKMARKNIKPAAFIHESLPGVAGQIIFPSGYLKDAYRYVRKAGGVCIADEVQVGFGRVGSHFWAFELQDVVPDILTLGKPIGNGHPLGAVVTTPEIAASFNNGMEYFNTFGGNPVSCAVGMAVLDVIKKKKLPANANKVGRFLLSRLMELKKNFPLIGDVRGQGLFIGIELVLDHRTLKPAPEQAAYIVERMKDRGILLSTDGPHRNVIKLKPPLVFTRNNAALLVDTLAEILQENFLKSD
jgi:4-aminobutyrate aminotransferase-like enzyme